MAGFSHAQNISSLYFTSEEEIIDALNSGEISYSQYVELMELIQEKVDLNGENLEWLLEIPGVTREEIRAIYKFRDEKGYYKSIEDFQKRYPYDYERILGFIKVIPYEKSLRGRAQIEGKHKYYTYQKFDLDYSAKNYLYNDFELRSMSVNLDLIQEGFGNMICKRRNFRWKIKDGSLILGNYKSEWAQGVLIGGYLYVSKSLKQAPPGDYFLYPYDLWLNGLSWNQKFGSWEPEVILSYNKFDIFSTALGAGRLSYHFDPRNLVGFAIMSSYLNNRLLSDDYNRFRQSGLSLYSEGSYSSLRYSIEYAILEDREQGKTVSLEYKKDRIFSGLTFWDYSNQFLNIYGRGPSNPDYYTDSLDSTGFDFNNPSAGEMGTAFNASYSLNKMFDLKWGYEYWVFKPENAPNADVEATVVYRTPFRLKTTLSYFHEKKHITGDFFQREYYRAIFDWAFRENINLYWYNNYKKENDPEFQEGLTTYLKARIRISNLEKFEINPRVKYYDPDFQNAQDGYLEYQVEHKIKFKLVDFSFRYALKDYIGSKSNEYQMTLTGQFQWK
ncbi:helix-hairpin-helix domain-containing protein [bacterium]|nr:helix-hairpin-helix domain-containing protein [bacterium]